MSEFELSPKQIGWMAAAVAVAAAIFGVDMVTPLGVAEPMLYVVPLLLTWFMPGLMTSRLMIGIVLMLTWGGAALSPGEFTFEAGANRGMATVILLVIGGLVINQKRLAEQRDADETVVRESEERFRHIFQYAGTGIAIADLSGRFIRCNPAYCAITGYTEDELIQMVFPALAHPEDREGNLQAIQAVLEDRQPSFEMESRYMHKAGHAVWVHKYLSVLYSRKGKPTHLITLVTDVTGRRREEELLQESNVLLERYAKERTTDLAVANERWDWVVRATNDGVWDWDLVHDTVYFSPRWREMHGFHEHERNETMADWSARLHPDDQPRVLKKLEEYLAGRGQEFWEEYRIQRKDGTYMWVLDRGVALWGEGGRAVRIVGAESDITRQKEAEVALRELSVRLLQVQEEERRRIARDLHDDVTQRLAVLTMELHGIKQYAVETGCDASVVSHVKALGESVERLTTDVQQLAHQLHPSILEHVGLEAAVREHVDEFAARTGLAVEVMTRKVPQPIQIEQATCLYRVLQESLQNVRKHAQASNVLVRLLGTNRGVGLCVHDDGQGFQAKVAAGCRKGLGLTSMAERVFALNGTFLVRAAPGNGTEIHAWVPLEDMKGGTEDVQREM